jgi:RNA-splicing ligase RtcB
LATKHLSRPPTSRTCPASSPRRSRYQISHWGYGFPIGGVAAFDLDEGVISAGGVGYDINCGVRLMASRLTREQIEPRLREVVNQLFRDVPTGVGAAGALTVSVDELAQSPPGCENIR